MSKSDNLVKYLAYESHDKKWVSDKLIYLLAGDPVTGVMVQKMRLGAPDVTGRQAPEVIEGADYVEEADLVIMALGLPVNRWGTIKADYVTGATALDGVYAVGDIVRGASLVVWAIKDGRDCAQAILDDFNGAQRIAAE